MKRIVPMVASTCVLCGCIFGQGGDPQKNGSSNNDTTTNNDAGTNGTNNGASNNGSNNQTTGTNNGGSNNQTTGTNNGGSNNDNNATNNTTGVTAQYLDLEATEANCIGEPTTVWFAPTDAPLNDTSAVAIGPNAVDGRMGPFGTAVGNVSVAYATSDDGALAIYAASGQLADGTTEIVPLLSGSTTIETDAEPYAVTITASTFNPDAAMPQPTALTLSIATSRGLYDCTLDVDATDATTISCGESAYTELLDGAGLQAPARVDLAPRVTAVQQRYRFNILDAEYFALASQSTMNGERLAAFRYDGVNDPTEINLGEVTSTGPDTLAERVVFGVTAASFGFPYFVMLDAQANGPVPVVLKSADTFGNTYEIDDSVEEWLLAPNVSPERGRFSFVDGYDINVVSGLLAPAIFDFDPGTVDFGYVAANDSGDELIFSKPGGFGGLGVDTFVSFELPEIQEVLAFKNLAVADGTTGRAAIAVIHGANRDKVAVFDWDFGLRGTWIADVLATEFSNARRVTPVWFFNDQGRIPMLAQRNGEWVLTVVNVPDLSNLGSACQ